jgi:hypothetical protein
VTDPDLTDHAGGSEAGQSGTVRRRSGMAIARREIGAVLVLIVIGGGGALFAASRVWLNLTQIRPAPFGPLIVHVHGRAEFGALSGLAVVTLLAGVLTLVTGRWARIALGVLLAVVALTTGWYGLKGFATPDATRISDLIGGSAKAGTSPILVTRKAVWPAITSVCAVMSLLAAIALIVRAPRWPAGLSAKYEAPAEVAKSDDPWRSLDRGEDPTIADR